MRPQSALVAAVAERPVMVGDLQPHRRFRPSGRTRMGHVAVWRDGSVRVAVNAKVYRPGNPKLWAILGPKAAVEQTKRGLKVTLPYGVKLRRVDVGDLPGIAVTQLYQRRDPVGILPKRRINLSKLDGLVA